MEELERQIKPFKTIEVTDRRTGNACKIACMSCIRGHRTTTCGSAVCKSKILWTVKRPGRPSNSCTCRFGSSGRCQCVTVKSACPHRPGKGEKRTVSCRCDEQGRWCCMLEAEDWEVLNGLQKPTIDFFPNPEALEGARLGEDLTSTPVPPSSSSVSTPRPPFSIPPSPAMPDRPMSAKTGQEQLSYQAAPQVPRFGMMGVGAPWGNEGHRTEDVLTWNGLSPQAPREIRPSTDFDSPFSSTVPPSITGPLQGISPTSQYHHHDFTPVTQSVQALNLRRAEPPVPPPTFSPSFLSFQAAYNTYQYPSAICQNCGMNGCTCKNCPAVMQNSENGSWAQCCSRKHVFPTTQACCARAQMSHGGLTLPASAPGLIPGDDPTLSQGFDLENADVMDFSQFLESDLQPPSTTHGCCGGGR